MLRDVIYFLLFLSTDTLCMAEDHKVWALQQQEKSQEVIKSYQEEALNLKNQSLSLKECSTHHSLGCSKLQNLKPIKTQQEFSDSSLYIFVSFSMPKETLKALAVEAKRHNAVLVIRGLTHNSFLKTAIFLKELGESVVLNPLLFRDYNVVVVPTFIEEHQAGYRKISGNITLAYAIQKFKEGNNE
jgi:type-F conjugative transfer system pilin assembly protein TrbC